MLCLHQLGRRNDNSIIREPGVDHPERRVRLKIGPLWKLAHVVEPMPAPTVTLIVRDENDGLLLLDGPFAETKQ